MATLENNNTPAAQEDLKALLAAKEAEIARMRKEAERQEKALAAKEQQLSKLSRSAQTGAAQQGGDPKRRVRVRVLKGPNNETEPLTLRVNDYFATIRRGVEVEIPYYAAKALEESLDADQQTLLRLSELTGRLDQIKPAG